MYSLAYGVFVQGFWETVFIGCVLGNSIKLYGGTNIVMEAPFSVKKRRARMLHHGLPHRVVHRARERSRR